MIIKDPQHSIVNSLEVYLLPLRKVMLISVLLVLFSACNNNKDIIVWIASPWQHVLQNTPPGDLKEVNLQAAGNEYESFRVIIHNAGEEELSGLNLSVSKLKSNEGEIHPGNYQLYRANYLHVTKPSSRSKNPPGYYPDALIPFAASGSEQDPAMIKYVAAPFSVDTASNAEIWCDLFVPKRTIPGTYHGTVSLKKDKKTLVKIPVSITVWDFELPDTFAMRSHFGSLRRNAVKMMGIEPGTLEFDETVNCIIRNCLNTGQFQVHLKMYGPFGMNRKV